jgi:PadR family transcriptional regulator, regulatory protein PadR
MFEPGHKSHEGCRCRGGPLRGFIQPQLLLQLAKQPAHGYELMETLSQSGDLASADPGNLYRLLRSLEDEGLVHSNWDTSAGGPARRVYELTKEGHEYLDTWVVNLRETRRRLDDFLADYENQFSIERNSKNVPM